MKSATGVTVFANRSLLSREHSIRGLHRDSVARFARTGRGATPRRAQARSWQTLVNLKKLATGPPSPRLRRAKTAKTAKANAQTEYITENEKDIYWQPNTQIDFSDYQSKSDTECVKFNKKYGLKMSSSIGFRGVVDVPKRKGRSLINFI